FNGAKELASFLGGAGWQEDAHHPRIIKTKVHLLAVGELCLQETAEMMADLQKFARRGQVNSPALAPSFFHEGLEQTRVLLQSDEIGRYLRQFCAFGSFVQ